MPQAQVINFGEDPYANAMGSFANNFLTTINEKAGQRRNEDIIKKITKNYGDDVKPEKMFRDILKAEGLDQEYKHNKLKEIKEFADLSNKDRLTPYQDAMLKFREEEIEIKKKNASEEKPMTAYQKKVIANQEARLKNEQKKIEKAVKDQDLKLPKYINDYSTSQLKEGNATLAPQDLSELNSFIRQLVTDPNEPLQIDEAFSRAYEFVEARRELIKTASITPKPSSWTGGTPTDIEKARASASEQLKKIYEQDGVNSQKDLRAIAKRSGWGDEEITKMLQKLFQSHGRKLRMPNKNDPNKTNVDDVLFGD